MAEKWVLVTGGARRLGREICLAFGRAGWHVLCHYQSSMPQALATCEDIRQFNVKALPVHGDLETEEGQSNLYRDACDAASTAPAAIVNNASMFEPDEAAHINTPAFERQLSVNLFAPLRLGALMAQQIQANGADPQVLMHVLDQKVFNLNPDYFSYTVSKLALERCVALQAQAFAPYIRVLGVAPGLLYVSGPQTPENFAAAASVNLLRRPTNPVDVANTCVFLAQTPSINGISVCVDNGQHLVPLARDVMFVAEALQQRSL